MSKDESTSVISQGSALHAAAEKLIAAAHDFWLEKGRAGQGAAVVWLEDSSGQVLIFTRGEMRDTIMSAIRTKEPGAHRQTVTFDSGQDGTT